MEDLPTYTQYKAQVNHMVDSGKLSLEQGILLCRCFKATLDESPVHINYLMQLANMSWKEISWTLNGLVQRGAIRRIEEKYYLV
tara:strand:- start:34 stop:285 length:252 start_codon:yes stop_codon:yes gene_type:complete